MTDQDISAYMITEPIPSTKEDYDKFRQRSKAGITCTEFHTDDGGWGCTGQCTITADYQEACVPRIFYDPDAPGGFIPWCECVEVREIQELIERGKKIEAGWPTMPDLEYVLQKD